MGRAIGRRFGQIFKVSVVLRISVTQELVDMSALVPVLQLLHTY